MTATKDTIISLPNPHLRQVSGKVSHLTSSVKQVIEDMKSATLDWEKSRAHEVAVALAAIQIDQARRIVIIRNNPDNKKDESFGVFINPEITKFEGPVQADFEGCLSVPDLYGKVPRYYRVRIKAEDASGQPVKVVAEGFLARLFQHEIDHLNGKVFVDHIKNKKKAFYKLEDSGELKQIDYEKDVKTNSILW